MSGRPTSSRIPRLLYYLYGRRLESAPVVGFMPKEQVSGAAIRKLASRA